MIDIPNHEIFFLVYLYEGSFLFTRTSHEKKRLEQEQKFIIQYGTIAFEQIVKIMSLINYKNILLFFFRRMSSQVHYRP